MSAGEDRRAPTVELLTLEDVRDYQHKQGHELANLKQTVQLLTTDFKEFKIQSEQGRKEIGENTIISKEARDQSRSNSDALIVTNTQLTALKKDTEISVTLTKSIKAWGIVFGALGSAAGLLVAVKTLGWL